MVNLVNVMTKPYMMVGNIAKSCLCGVGDLVDDTCGRTSTRGVCCGAGAALSTLNPFDGRDESEPLRPNLFGGTFQGKNTKYEDHTWDRLPGRVRNAAKTLGMDQATWDAQGWTVCEDKSWYDLTSDEKQAAETLGWDASAWDYRYEDKSWNELPNHAQKAAESLGFNQYMWDNDTWPAVGEKYWGEMTNDEKKALHVLGYYSYIW
eukprot:CAMPEP_0197247036 /NCGR_PEP_ID=MMETSP1429-20130617/25993_1 /TAXON_ID=49237 /ORGANISM="Chaetoceros  sp., Strain UNC1202" /LENGTH=205 /DNA_ID=CAMNT_0042707841 /DNA_START=79 /DNA_END=693 /DNA_ORIENTATION=+